MAAQNHKILVSRSAELGILINKDMEDYVCACQEPNSCPSINGLFALSLRYAQIIILGILNISLKDMGSPIKERGKRINTSPMQKIYFFCLALDGKIEE